MTFITRNKPQKILVRESLLFCQRERLRQIPAGRLPSCVYPPKQYLLIPLYTNKTKTIIHLHSIQKWKAKMKQISKNNIVYFKNLSAYTDQNIYSQYKAAQAIDAKESILFDTLSFTVRTFNSSSLLPDILQLKQTRKTSCLSHILLH